MQPPHETLYQPDAPLVSSSASPVPARLEQGGSGFAFVYTRGDRFIRPSELAATRSNFEVNLQRALGGQAMLTPEVLARAYGIAGNAFSCSETRASIAASIPLYVGDPDENPLDNTPLDWFSKQQAAQILYEATLSLLIWGRAFLRKLYNDEGLPTGLELINPTDVIYERVDYKIGDVVEYDVRHPITGKVSTLNASELVYMQMFDSKSGGTGLSRFEVAWRELHVQMGMATFQAAFFVNSAQPDGILTFENENVDEDYIELAEKQWQKSFKGARNAHRTAVLPPNAKWIPLQSAPKDLAMGELDAKSVRRVHEIFQTPEALTGAGDVSDPLSANSTYSAVEVSHIRNVALPTIRRVMLFELNRQWAHRDFGRQNYYTLYVDEGQIPALAEANLVKISGARDATAANLFDYDEGRDIVGYEPRKPGEYFIRNIDEAVKAWQAGGISLNLLQWYMRGVRSTDPNGEVILVGGMLIPLARVQELANANVERMKGPPVMFTSPFGQSGMSSTLPAETDVKVSKPPTPALPAPAPTPEPEVRGGKDSLCIALGYANQPDLVGLQHRLRQLFPDPDAVWSDPEDLHVTVLYAPNVSDEQARQMVQMIRALEIPQELALRIGSLNSFDALGEYSLHFRVRRNTALLDLQESIYEQALWANIGVSNYSTPAAYKPHVTMGKLHQKPSPITFDPKLSLEPTSIWVYRGDAVIYERPLQMPALPMPSPDLQEVTKRSYLGAPSTGNPGASVILTLANAGQIVELQEELRAQFINPATGFEYPGVRWTALDALHVTLISASVVDDTQLRQVVGSVLPGTLPGFRLKVGPLSAFEQDSYNVLILPVEVDEAMLTLRGGLYEHFRELGVPMSRYSDPDQYQAHITVAYLPKDLPVPTDDRTFDLSPNAITFSRETFETVASFPLAVEVVPPLAQVRREAPLDPLEIGVAFPNAQVLKYARRDLDSYLRDYGYANPQWRAENTWHLELVALDQWTPGEAAKIIRKAEFDDTRKIDLWTDGFHYANGVVYLRIEESEALDRLRTGIALEVQEVGRTPIQPAVMGIPLCDVDGAVDLAGAPEAHYPLVIGNVTLWQGTRAQHQWTLRSAPRQSETELNNWEKTIRKRGWEYNFRREYLRDTSTELFVLAAHEAEIEDDTLWDLAGALLRGEWTLRTYADTQSGFIDAISDLFIDGQSNDISRQKFGAQLRMYLRGYGLQAFRDGMKSAGYDPESFSTDELAVFRRWQEQQSAYVTNLGAELFGPGVSESVIEQRVQMWADISLGEIYLRGVAIANAEQLYEWEHHPSAKHCRHCPQLNGQVHTITEWLDEELYPGSGRTECGPGCKCRLKPTTGRKRGNFLRSVSPDEQAPDDAPAPVEAAPAEEPADTEPAP